MAEREPPKRLRRLDVAQHREPRTAEQQEEVGKRTLTQQPAEVHADPASAAVFFDRGIEEARNRLVELRAALQAVDAARAISAASALRTALDAARGHVANTPAETVAERRRALDQLADAALPNLQGAPGPSRQALREGIAGSCVAWDRELERWRRSRVAAATPRPSRHASAGVTVQLKAEGQAPRPADARVIAATGVSAAGATLPFADQIQRAFGRHDVSNVRVQIGGAAIPATRALGARAYASLERIAFRAAPDLHTAAHEAAHIIQQRAGVQLDDNLGRADDGYERAADEVADAVVAGHSAERLLDKYGRAAVGSGRAVVQLKRAARQAKAASTSFADQHDKKPTAVSDDGELIHEKRRSTGSSKGSAVRGRSSKPLASAAETVTVTDDVGDVLKLEITYRIETRPAEIGEVPDTWVYTERKAILTLASGEHAGATIYGNAKITIGPNELIDPKAAIQRQSIGPSHAAEIYLDASGETVSEFGLGGRKTLVEDAAASKLLAYGDPLVMLGALKHILKRTGVAGHGKEVARLHRDAPRFVMQSRHLKQQLDALIRVVKSYKDRTPEGQIALADSRALVERMADWLAEARRLGRAGTDQARKVSQAHADLVAKIAETEAARPPPRNHQADLAVAPLRFVGRTAMGIAEVGAMAVDAIALGVVSAANASGADLEWDPVSDYGKAVQRDGRLGGAKAVAHGFVDTWSDALERAGNGDYRAITDVGIDTALMLEGGRTALPKIPAAKASLLAKFESVSRSSRKLAGKVPGEVADIAAAMADAADAFIAKQQAAGMQTAGAGGPRGPGAAGPTPQSVAEGVQAAKDAFRDKRVSQSKDHTIDKLKERLGAEKAPHVAEWVTRVEAALRGDPKATMRFFEGVRQRITDPAPFMRKVESLLGATNLSANDVVIVLSDVLGKAIANPTAVLGEIEWLVTTRRLSAETRSMLVKRAVKGQVDLDWVRRTTLTDVELEIMGQDSYTSWKEFEQVSDISSKRAPGRLAGRSPGSIAIQRANAKSRGIAGELVAAEIELPHGLKVKRRIASDNTESSSDYELVAPDGTLAELEVKAQRPKNWDDLLDEFETAPAGEKEGQLARLVKQVEAGNARGRRVYVAITDGISTRSRARLLKILETVHVRESQLVLMPEAEIKRVGRQLREHMGIPQPGSAGKKVVPQ